ncbi:MAG: glyoxalase [Candidatus Eremiobacteraeota bacterium]|nr:glyoxalase [Candidatus Eremiobacteraeota bacterium]
MSIPFTAVDHVQVAIPLGSEDRARDFYGRVLGLEEIPKPAELAVRGGVWFRSGGVSIHLGTDANFCPAVKAHPAFRCAKYDELVARLRYCKAELKSDPDVPSGRRHCYVFDPFGNRIELID